MCITHPDPRSTITQRGRDGCCCGRSPIILRLRALTTFLASSGVENSCGQGTERRERVFSTTPCHHKIHTSPLFPDSAPRRPPAAAFGVYRGWRSPSPRAGSAHHESDPRWPPRRLRHYMDRVLRKRLAEPHPARLEEADDVPLIGAERQPSHLEDRRVTRVPPEGSSRNRAERRVRAPRAFRCACISAYPRAPSRAWSALVSQPQGCDT